MLSIIAALNGPTEPGLARLAVEDFDVLVVGGGVIGCGAALDAAARGLSVALVEQHELASGTSSRSSKLIHGGLRYLEQLQLGVVREALRERALLLRRIAPGLVQPLPFLYPLTGSRWEALYVGTGLTLYDALAGTDRGLPRHRRLGRAETLTLAPGLHPSVTGSFGYWDATVDDRELTLALADTAVAYGATIVTHARATGFARGTARVRSRGDELQVRARHVLLAAGVWSEGLERLAGSSSPPLRITASKGVHVVVPRERVESETALIVRTRASVLLVIPFHDRWLVGTTDTPYDGDPEDVAATEEEIAYLLGQANRLLASPLRREDVVDVFAGLRPLVATRGGRTTRLSRTHVVVPVAPGVTAVGGGKLTTYRTAARDAVDAVARALGHTTPSRTDELPLRVSELSRA